MDINPIEEFAEWFSVAKTHPEIVEPTAMALATATKDGAPSVRIVLLKEFDEQGFVFYTNLESRKSGELKQNPKAALCFYWMQLERQIRIEGDIEPVSDYQADAYFATRHRDSQIGAWSSKQSRELASTNDLLQSIADNLARFNDGTVPRPPFWSGWRLVPRRIEFWQQGDFRLHDRRVFTRSGNNWQLSQLYP